MGRRDDTESAQRAQPVVPDREGILLGVSGRRLSGTPYGAARNRPEADRRGVWAGAGGRRIHAMGTGTADVVALSERGCSARAAPPLRQRGTGGTALRV